MIATILYLYALGALILALATLALADLLGHRVAHPYRFTCFVLFWPVAVWVAIISVVIQRRNRRRSL
jgi:hypothetical protein